MLTIATVSCFAFTERNFNTKAQINLRWLNKKITKIMLGLNKFDKIAPFV